MSVGNAFNGNLIGVWVGFSERDFPFRAINLNRFYIIEEYEGFFIDGTIYLFLYIVQYLFFKFDADYCVKFIGAIWGIIE